MELIFNVLYDYETEIGTNIQRDLKNVGNKILD